MTLNGYDFEVKRWHTRPTKLHFSKTLVAFQPGAVQRWTAHVQYWKFRLMWVTFVNDLNINSDMFSQGSTDVFHKKVSQLQRLILIYFCWFRSFVLRSPEESLKLLPGTTTIFLSSITNKLQISNQGFYNPKIFMLFFKSYFPF